MKSLKIALLLALLLPLSSNALSTHPSKAPSYKSGFSSQKNSAPASRSSFGSFAARQQPAAPAPTPASTPAPKGGFGSFGNAPAGTAPADARPTSALSKDLDQRSANANALKTLDARNDARNGGVGAGQPLPPLNNPVPGQRPGYGQPYPQQGYQQPAQPYYPQPVIVQQQSSGWGSMFMGFMLGRALSGGHHDNYYYQNGGGNNGNNGYDGNGANNANNGANNAAYPAGTISDNASGSVANQSGAAVDNPPPPKPSFAMSALRIFLWLLILGCLGWLLVFGVRLLRGGKASNGANYSFKRD